MRAAELEWPDVPQPGRGGQPPRATGAPLQPDHPGRPLDGRAAYQEEHQHEGKPWCCGGGGGIKIY